MGPGHCSVVDTPAGDTYLVYHAWEAGHVNGPGDARLMLTDAVIGSGGWPSVPEGAARLRITPMSSHREDEIDALVDAVAEELACDVAGSSPAPTRA